MPSLNVGRYRCGSFMTKDRKYLYCLKGYEINGNPISSFERINLFAESTYAISEPFDTDLNDFSWDLFEIQEPD